jgi:hypothetical protein
MQRSSNGSNSSDHRFLWNRTAGILAVHGVIVLVLVGLVLSYPAVSEWIAQSVQAEFVGNQPPISGPGTQMRTVRADHNGHVDPPSNTSAWSAAEANR